MRVILSYTNGDTVTLSKVASCSIGRYGELVVVYKSGRERVFNSELWGEYIKDPNND